MCKRITINPIGLALPCKTEKESLKKGHEAAGTQRIISRLFTQILRRTAEENGIEPQTDGYLPSDSLLSCKAILKTGLKLTYDDVDKIVSASSTGTVETTWIFHFRSSFFEFIFNVDFRMIFFVWYIVSCEFFRMTSPAGTSY